MYIYIFRYVSITTGGWKGDNKIMGNSSESDNTIQFHSTECLWSTYYVESHGSKLSLRLPRVPDMNDKLFPQFILEVFPVSGCNFLIHLKCKKCKLPKEKLP